MPKREKHIVVEMDELPGCDICTSSGKRTTAMYDGKTIYGPWAFMCDEHFDTVGIGVGLGKGQHLVLRSKR